MKLNMRFPWYSLPLALFGTALVVLPEMADTGRIVEFKPVIQSFGGAILGAAFAIVSTIPAYNSFISFAKRTLQEGVDVLPFVNAHLIRNYGSVWYFYWISQMDGESFWRMIKLDFTLLNGNVRATNRIYLLNKNNEKEYYFVEAIARFRRLVIYFYPEEYIVEPPMTAVIEVFDVSDNYAGHIHLMSWDRKHIFAPCILSRKPICGASKQQIRIDSDTSKKIEGVWRDEVKSKPVI